MSMMMMTVYVMMMMMQDYSIINDDNDVDIFLCKRYERETRVYMN